MADNNVTPKWNSTERNGVTYSFVTAETAEPVCALTTETDMFYLVTAEVVAGANDNYDETNSYIFAGSFKNDGGTLTQTGTTTPLHSAEDHAGWAAGGAMELEDAAGHLRDDLTEQDPRREPGREAAVDQQRRAAGTTRRRRRERIDAARAFR